MTELSFFSNEGLTSTSANHIANKAKEWYQEQEYYLNHIQFYETKVSVIGSNESALIETGITNTDLVKIPKLIKKIYSAKALMSWLREAIKRKDQMLQDVKLRDVTIWAKMNNITLPKPPTLKSALTEEEYFDSLSIKALNEYYTLEGKCATIGKLIHPNGSYSNARVELLDKKSNKRKVIGTGRDMNIYSYQITVDPTLVENQFFDLLDEHRKYQANLNSIKHACQEAMQKSAAEVNAEYEVELKKYNAQMNEYMAQWKIWELEETKRISALKIVIPDNLREIYETINKL